MVHPFHNLNCLLDSYPAMLDLSNKGGITMDILEFVNIYLNASDEVKCQIEEILNILSEHPADLEEVLKSDCKFQ